MRQGEDHVRSNGRRDVTWVCQCDCGNIVTVKGDNLKSGNSKSCGCLSREIASKGLIERNIKHGGKRTRLVNIWHNMRARCYNEKNTRYDDYGGRGISICDEWRDDFIAFKTWALNNGYDESLTIDRIDVNGNYCPENCRWVTRKVQSNNTRRNKWVSHDGETKTIAQWAEELNISPFTLYTRASYGWSDEEILLGRG